MENNGTNVTLIDTHNNHYLVPLTNPGVSSVVYKDRVFINVGLIIHGNDGKIFLEHKAERVDAITCVTHAPRD